MRSSILRSNFFPKPFKIWACVVSVPINRHSRIRLSINRFFMLYKLLEFTLISCCPKSQASSSLRTCEVRSEERRVGKERTSRGGGWLVLGLKFMVDELVASSLS